MPIDSVSPAPVLSVKGGVTLFIATLVAFVTESQLAQYVQTTLHYRQPFFMFYLVHSSFSIMFPLHFFYLVITTKYSSVALLRGLQLAVISHQSPPGSTGFPIFRFTRLVVCLTLGVTVPSLLWFAAVTLASITDVTAIWNTNAIFAYLFTVKLFGLRWEARKLIAVSLATVGVIIVVYGGSKAETDMTPKPKDVPLNTVFDKPSAPLIGNLLTLVASVGYGLYQVLYKRYAALPSDPESKEQLLYEAIPGEDSVAVNNDRRVLTAADLEDDAVYPPPLGLYPNLLTSLIGICTLALLWVFLPVLHENGIETFHLPPNGKTALCIVIISFTGMIFNAGLMILLAMWGPIITSVGGLLTIVLVLISDTLFGNGLETLTIWSLVGSGAIIFAFGVLAYDIFMA